MIQLRILAFINSWRIVGFVVCVEWGHYRTAIRTTPNEPRFLPTLLRISHESCRINLIRLDSGLGHENFIVLNFFKFSGRAPDQPRIIKNHPDSPQTCYGSPRNTQTLLRLNPTHPDSRFVAHSAPDSGMCNWGFNNRVPRTNNFPHNG